MVDHPYSVLPPDKFHFEHTFKKRLYKSKLGAIARQKISFGTNVALLALGCHRSRCTVNNRLNNYVFRLVSESVPNTLVPLLFVPLQEPSKIIVLGSNVFLPAIFSTEY